MLVGTCAFTLVLLALLALGRTFSLDAATSPQVPKNTASAIWDILVRNLRYGVMVLAVIGIIVAIVAYFVGPSAPAVTSRGMASKGIGGLRSRAEDAGYEPRPVAKFVGLHRRGRELAS